MDARWTVGRIVVPVHGDRRMRRQAGAIEMKAVVTTLATTLVTGFLVAGAVARVAAGSSESREPSAIERLVRQEDARRSDPALGATREWESVGIADPWILRAGRRAAHEHPGRVERRGGGPVGRVRLARRAHRRGGRSRGVGCVGRPRDCFPDARPSPGVVERPR